VTTTSGEFGQVQVSSFVKQSATVRRRGELFSDREGEDRNDVVN